MSFLFFKSVISQTPLPKIVQSFVYMQCDNSVVWNNTLGHVYRWASLICCCDKTNMSTPPNKGKRFTIMMESLLTLSSRYHLEESHSLHVAWPLIKGNDYRSLTLTIITSPVHVCKLINDPPAFLSAFTHWYTYSDRRTEKKDFILLVFFLTKHQYTATYIHTICLTFGNALSCRNSITLFSLTQFRFEPFWHLSDKT